MIASRYIAELQGVTVKYGERTILNALDLNIVAGAVTCLIGLSGAGKSTILRLINGLRVPSQGSVFIEGKQLQDRRPNELITLRQSIGFSFQFAALFDSLSIFDNVALPLRETTKLREAEIAERVAEVLHLVGLEPYAKSMPAELSGGMVKRAGFARAVVTRPRIVLYDEPTTGLDPIMTRALTETIRRLQQRDSSTCVVVSHDLASIAQMADYVAMIYEGKIIAFGTRDEVFGSNDPRVAQFVQGRIDGPIHL